MKKLITIIIPCYNEEAVIDSFYQESILHINQINNYDFIYLFIDDGSKDKTLQLVKELAQNDQRVKYLSFSRNFGKEAAMLAGLRLSKQLNADACFFIDADLQDPPSLIPTFISYWEQGYKHVYGKHQNRHGQSIIKKIFTMTFYRLYAKLTNDKNLAKGARDFSLLDKNVIDAFLSINDFKRFTKGISSFVGFKKKCVEFAFNQRVAGDTKWSFKSLYRYAILGINQFSRFYLLIPKLIIFIAFSALIFDIAAPYIFNYPLNHYHIRLDIAVILITIVLKILLKVLYDIRDQNRNRPIYIPDETNIK